MTPRSSSFTQAPPPAPPAPLASRHFGRAESRVHPLTLAFFDAGLEATYRLSTQARSARRSRWSSAAFLGALAVLGAFEFAFGYSGGTPLSHARLAIGAVRCASGASALAFALLVSPEAPHWQRRGRPELLERLTAAEFALQGALLVAAVAAGCAFALPAYLPFAWWSSSFDMLHCALTQLSGLRFPLAAALALVHPLALLLGYAAAGRFAFSKDDLDQLGMLLVCILSCLLVAYRREHLERKEFVSHVNTTADKRLREQLLDEMLPQKIRDALQYGPAALHAQANAVDARAGLGVGVGARNGNRAPDRRCRCRRRSRRGRLLARRLDTRRGRAGRRGRGGAPVARAL